MPSLFYQACVACTQVNEYTTGWFSQFCIKQVDVLSQAMFSFIIAASNLGFGMDDQIPGILLYANYIVLHADQEKDLQIKLNIVVEWYRK